MLKLPLAAIAATLLTATIATAQTSSTTTITPQQQMAIKTYVTKEKTKSISAPSGYTMSVGSTLPSTVELHRFGSEAGLSQYEYVVIDNRTVVVDPKTRKVIEVVD